MAEDQIEAVRIPVGDAFPGLTVHADPEVDELDFCFMLYKYRDSSARSQWGYRTSSAPNLEELLGALQVQAALIKNALIDEWDDDSED